MVNFSNGYSIATESNQQTLIINFLQQVPETNTDGSIGEDLSTNIVGSYILERDTAINLSTAILNLLNENGPQKEISEE